MPAAAAEHAAMVRAAQGGREAEYRDLVARHARSGLTVREFAEHEGIAVQTFYWWRSELRRRDRLRAARSSAPSPFVRVTAKSPPPPRVDAGSPVIFEVRWPDGLTVRVPHQFDDEELRRLLVALGRPC